MHDELRRGGLKVNEKRVRRLMRLHGMAGRCRRRRCLTTFPGPDGYVIPDLVGRCFEPGAPDRAWCQDITYVPTGEGWLYVASVLDLKVFFSVVDKDPVDVEPADVLAFIKAQRTPRRGSKVVRIEGGEAGLSARTIKRRLATIAGLYEYLIIRGDTGVTRNPVPRGLAVRRPGQRAVRGVPLIRAPRTLPRVIDPDEVEVFTTALRAMDVETSHDYHDHLQMECRSEHSNSGPTCHLGDGSRRMVVSDSRWRGVRPHQEARWAAERKRWTSPISATRIAAIVGPIPGICWMAW
jgi:integrase